MMNNYLLNPQEVLADLRRFAKYQPETGKFICIATTKGRTVPVGGELGHLGPTTGYLYISIKKIRHTCHALAWLWMTGEWHTKQIDHINQNRTDNRWSNLRQVTPQQNQYNRKRTGGVGFHKASGKWRAYLTVNNKAMHLGLFSTKEEAEAVHLRAYQARKDQVFVKIQ